MWQCIAYSVACAAVLVVLRVVSGLARSAAPFLSRRPFENLFSFFHVQDAPLPGTVASHYLLSILESPSQSHKAEGLSEQVSQSQI